MWRGGGRHIPMVTYTQAISFVASFAASTSSGLAQRRHLQESLRDPGTLLALQTQVCASLQHIADFQTTTLNQVLVEAARSTCGAPPVRLQSSPWQDAAISRPIRSMWMHYQALATFEQPCIAFPVPGLDALDAVSCFTQGTSSSLPPTSTSEAW